CAWRNVDTQLHRQLRCHARLSPSRILFCHLHDEFADVLRNSWPTGLRLPFQNNWKPLRCQPIRVSGLTMTKASFQWHRRDQTMREKRAESFNRLGWTYPHRRPVAFAGTEPPRSGLCASGTGDGRKEEKKYVPGQISDQVKQRIP